MLYNNFLIRPLPVGLKFRGGKKILNRFVKNRFTMQTYPVLHIVGVFQDYNIAIHSVMIQQYNQYQCSYFIISAE